MKTGRKIQLMKPSIVMIIGLLMVVVISSLGGASESSDHTVIVLTEDTEYDAEENVTLEVLFYYLDSRVDVDQMNISLGDPLTQGRYIEVDLIESRMEEGRYQVIFPIHQDDLNDSADILTGTVRCSVDDGRGEFSDSSEFTLLLAGETVDIIVTTDHPDFEPGQTVRFSVKTILSGFPFTPDSLNATLTINDAVTSPVLTEDGTGNYHYDHISPDDTVGGKLVFTVFGEHNSRNFSTSAHADLIYYHVWFDVSENSEAGISGTLGITDRSGRSVESIVDLAYTYPDMNGTIIEDVQNDIMCEDGTAQLYLPFVDIARDVREITLQLWANGSGARSGEYQQFVRVVLPVSGAYSPEGSGFETVYTMNVYPIPLASEETLTFTAFQDGQLLNNTLIYYFVQTTPNTNDQNDQDGGYGYNGYRTEDLGSILSVGNVTTDENGEFGIPIVSPNMRNNILMKGKYLPDTGRYGDGDWVEFIHAPIPVGSMFHIVQDIEIEVTDLRIGDLTTISISNAGHNAGTGSVQIIPIRKELPEEMLDDALHSMSTNGWSNLDHLVPTQWGHYMDGEFTLDIPVPQFFTNDTNYLIVVTTWNGSHPSTPFIRGYIAIDSNGNEVDPLEVRLTIDAIVPDDINSDSMKPITIQINANTSVEGVSVTLETTALLETCKSQTTTDYTGTIYCLIRSSNITGEDRTATIWINATKDGYSSAYFRKEVLIYAWKEQQELTLTTDLPDILGSAETRSMLMNVTSHGEGVPGVRITIEAVGSGRTCKEAGTTDAQGIVSCAVFANHVIGRNSTVTIFLNGTKTGYDPVFYTKTIIIMAENAPDEFIEPIALDLANGTSVIVRASVVGEVTISVIEAGAPDEGDTHTLGSYVDITMNGTGTLRWVNVTFSYTEIDPNITEENLRVFYWDDTFMRWKPASNAGVDIERSIIYANVTRLNLFSPREQSDVDPPIIHHESILRADPDTNITIIAIITDSGNEVKVVTLYYRTVGESIYTIINMVANGSFYSAVIPSYDVVKDQTIEYFIRANDGLNTASHPENTSQPLRIKVGEKENGEEDPTYGIIFVTVLACIIIVLLYMFVNGDKDEEGVNEKDRAGYEEKVKERDE